MATILLVRHGQTDWNAERRWQGHADPPLNELGRTQAQELAAAVTGRGLSAIYSSDLRRAQETAQIVGAAVELPVTRDPELREIDVGEWSGLTSADIEVRYPAGFERHRAGGDGWERGETHAAMQRRIVEAATRIAAGHDGETVLLVIHGGTIRALLAHAEGVPLDEFRRRPWAELGNGSLSEIALGNGG